MMIYLIHENRYWTEYLDSVLEDETRFSLVYSSRCQDTIYKDKQLDLFDPQKHKIILSAGYVYDKTDNNLIICRYHHSPGFNIHPIIEGYFRLIANHPNSDFRYIILKEHYQLLVMTDYLPEKHAYIRDKMMKDPRVSTSVVDTMLCKVKQTPHRSIRKKHTALISPNWLIAKEDPHVLTELQATLSKKMDLTFVVHPLTTTMGGDPNFLEKTKRIFGEKNVVLNIPRKEMISLYDQHEYIVTDGSGTCYEAMIRGCIPLMINNLEYQKNNKEFHSACTEGLLPFPDYQEFSGATCFDNDAFLLKHFPYIYTHSEEEAKTVLKQEILTLI